MLSKLWASEPVVVSTILPVLLAALVAVTARYVLGRTLTVDELVALFGVAGLGGGAVARSQVVPTGNVLPQAAAMMLQKKKESTIKPPPMPVLALVLLGALCLVGCTSSQADLGVQIATGACEVVVAAVPGAGAAGGAICASIAEVEAAYKALEAAGVLPAHEPVKAGTVIRDSAVYAQILKARGVTP